MNLSEFKYGRPYYNIIMKVLNPAFFEIQGQSGLRE